MKETEDNRNNGGPSALSAEADSRDYVIATYRVRDKAEKLDGRAEGIAVGLTVGSWTDLPAAKQPAVLRHCGRVEGIRVQGDAARDTVVANISIGYPVENFTDTITSILTTVFGKLSMDGEIRLVGLHLPDTLRARFPGPKFGVAGIRDGLSVHNRPLLMSIFKACVGRDIGDLTEAFTAQARGGADLVKDDEIFFSEAYATPEDRVRAFQEAAKGIEEETGRRVSYAVNLTGPVSKLLDRARRLSDLGAGALLVNAVAYGYDVLTMLAADDDVTVPLMIHPAVSGALYGSPDYGIAADIVLGKLMRLAGADIVIYPSPYGSVTLPREEGLSLVRALREESVHKQVLPAPSAGIYPGLVPKLVADLGVDCIVNAGGAIHGHPGGTADGAAAFAAAIDATVLQVPLQEAASTSTPLAAAIKKWGTGE